MPVGPRPRRDPTDDWDQLRLLVASPELAPYRTRRRRDENDGQAPLFTLEQERASG